MIKYHEAFITHLLSNVKRRPTLMKLSVDWGMGDHLPPLPSKLFPELAEGLGINVMGR